jgi:hypothetical protein
MMRVLLTDDISDEHAARTRALLERVEMPDAAVIVVGGPAAAIAGQALRAGILPAVELALNLAL